MTNTLQIQVATAEGPVLDWLVTKCEAEWPQKQWRYFGRVFNPSTNQEHADPIITREGILVEFQPFPSDSIYHDPDNQFVACIGTAFNETATFMVNGPTREVAAMRCYAWSKLGETVELPSELATLLKK